MSLVLLFLHSFLAATILPFPSELSFTLMLNDSANSALALILVAGIGNTLGGMLSFYMGFFGKKLIIEKYFRVSMDRLHSFEGLISKRGHLLAFFCWLPFAGDPLAIALGFFKLEAKKILVFMAAGKFLRYAALAYGTQFF